MSLICVGINHELAPVELRERLAVPSEAVGDTLLSMYSAAQIGECVVVSTCNRVEVYAAAEADSTIPPTTQVIDFLKTKFAGLNEDALTELPLYHHEGLDAAKHLFRVASGLDSMVLGETEIFGQVKKAYLIAQETGTTKGRLNKLFQNAFRVGKRIRTETEIQRGSTSVGSVAVDLAEKIFGGLKKCNVLILGAGEMSRTTAQSLASRGAIGIRVANRSIERAEALAAPLGGTALAFDRWPSQLPEIDIIISSTSADGYVVHHEQIHGAIHSREGRPLFLIDIAVPRDIDPAIDELNNVYLYDIDTIEGIAAQARKKREKQIALCEKVITEEAEEFIGTSGA